MTLQARFLPVFALVLALGLTGCNAANTSNQSATSAPEAEVQSAEPAEAIQMMGIEEETDDAAAAIGNTSEQAVIQRAELERIRREGEQSQGLVRNAPDYNR